MYVYCGPCGCVPSSTCVKRVCRFCFYMFECAVMTLRFYVCVLACVKVLMCIIMCVCFQLYCMVSSYENASVYVVCVRVCVYVRLCVCVYG